MTILLEIMETQKTPAKKQEFFVNDFLAEMDDMQGNKHGSHTNRITFIRTSVEKYQNCKLWSFPVMILLKKSGRICPP